MRLSKEEIEAELAHRREVVSALIRRRRPLELQAAQKGLSTPPEVLTEITTIDDQVRLQEEKIAQLETLAAEGQLSVLEAKYRVMLARAWETLRGRPTLAGAAELELARIEMGLLPERAQQIEQEVRTSLAEEAFSDIDSQFQTLLPTVPETIESNIGHDEKGEVIAIMEEMTFTVLGKYYVVESNIPTTQADAYRSLGRAIRLDSKTALKLFLVIFPEEVYLDMNEFGRQLLVLNRVWNFQEDSKIFNEFLADLTKELERKYGK